jgi:hypothetical protein
MSENVGASTSRNPKDLHGLYMDNFTFTSHIEFQEMLWNDMSGTRKIQFMALCELGIIVDQHG